MTVAPQHRSPSPASPVTVFPSVVPANGVFSAHVTTQIIDVALAPIAGASVTLSLSSASAHAVGGAPTDPGGVTSWDVTDTVGENVQLVLTVDGVLLGTQPTIMFVSPPVFVSASPPSTVAAGAALSYQFVATGFPQPMTYSLSSGALPSGLQLTPGGLLSGTATIPGIYSFTVSTSTIGGYAEASAMTITVQGPDLTLSMSGAAFVSNADMVVSLRVGNTGNVTARGPITVVDNLPVGLSYRRASGEDLRCTIAGRTLTCVTTDPIRAGRSTTIKLTLHVSAPVGTTLTNSATVSSGAFEPTPASNTASRTGTVIRR